MKDQYDCLNKAQLSFEYLHTNSTTHTFLFGALAELVDNSKDAGAKNLDIYTCKDPLLRGGFYLAFLDDGCGMHYDDVFNVIVFGKSAKRHSLSSNQIGQYGNGLKSGAMRISKDFILFTKKDNIGTCLFISRTFHQQERITQIICPMPCFDLITRQSVHNVSNDRINGARTTYIYDKSRHELEMQLIMKYSPFKTKDDLFKQFDLIKSSSGTLIILYNVKLTDTGESELDIKTDPYDILIDSRNRRNLFKDDDEYSTPSEYRSLRAYVSILYYDPCMRITIQRRRVITKKLSYTLYKPRQYQFKSTRFNTRTAQEIQNCEKELVSLEERIHEVDSQIYHIQHTSDVTTSIDTRTQLRKLEISAVELKDLANRLRNDIIKYRSDMNTTKSLLFIFGLNVQNRIEDGFFVYSRGRLIKMYEKIGQLNKKALYCRGVVGIVDISSVILEPTHNKQSFVDAKEYHYLLKNMSEYMRQYWADTGIEHYVKEFWETYGYRDDQLDRPPSNDPEAVKRRQLATLMLIQCDQCLKWRRLPNNDIMKHFTQSQLESWTCSDNTDILNNTCSANQKLDIISEGELKPKSQSMNDENRLASKTVSQSDRSLANSKCLSIAEISSTTNSNSKILTRSSVTHSSTMNLQKLATPKPQLLSQKTKHKKKKKRLIKNNIKIPNFRSVLSDDDDDDQHEIQSFTSTTKQTSNQASTFTRSSSTANVYLIDDDDDNIENIVSTNKDINNHRPPPKVSARLSTMHQGASLISKDSMKTSTEINVNEEEPLVNIAEKFKKLIKFMLPPDWELTREQISTMHYNELSQFDMSTFMQSYREKMTKIVEQHKIDESRWRTAAQRIREETTKLFNLSGMPIPTDCPIKDFEEHLQNYIEQFTNGPSS